MKRLLLCLLLAACATSSAADVPSALRGCWIERRGADTITIRWFPGANGSWRGDQLFYRAGEEPAHQGFRIDPTAGENEHFGWAICPLEDGLPHDGPCQRLVFGNGHSEGGSDDWMELHVSGERMRLIMLHSGEGSAIFDGARDGCD